jgi:peptidyl-prolyl cis-trans isomerase A (cyclophilin A)
MFKRMLITAAALLSFVLATPAALAANTHVLLATSMGNIEIELFDDKAPISTQNFIDYVKQGHYDQTIFHRVIPGFMIQGGGFDASMNQKKTNAPIKNEADNGLRNERGTIAMARTSQVDSATSQFFINVVNNNSLNHSGTSPSAYGYAVFGQVVKGMDVVDKIVAVETGNVGGHQNVPRQPVTIISADVLN